MAGALLREQQSPNKHNQGAIPTRLLADKHPGHHGLAEASNAILCWGEASLQQQVSTLPWGLVGRIIPGTNPNQKSVVAHAFNPSTSEEEAGGSRV